MTRPSGALTVLHRQGLAVAVGVEMFFCFRRKAQVLLACAAGVFSLVTQAVARADAATGPAASGGEIIVTARRREEALETVPEAIAAFSQGALTRRAILNGFGLNAAVPGLTVESDAGNGGRAIFAIRGRGQNYGAAAGSVETYFAEVPLSGPFEMPTLGPQYFDLESLQVLKGPQGTLFGRSTTGGAVLFVPQAPTDRLGGYVRLQGGDYGDFQFEGAVNAPLAGDKAELRLAAFDWQRDGYSRTLGGAAGASPLPPAFGGGRYTDAFGRPLPPQTYDNQDVQQFRATLRLHPTAALMNSTIFAYNTDNDRGTPKLALVNPASQLGGGALFLYPGILGLGPRVANIDTRLDHGANRAWAVINTTTYQLTAELLIKNILGYIDADGYSNVSNDVDGAPLGAIDTVTPLRRDQNYQTTDELQLQGGGVGGRLSWIVGALLDHTDEPRGNDLDVYNDSYGGGAFDVVWEQSAYRNYGVFGSATLKLTDQISVGAGERHSWFGVSLRQVEAIAPSAAAFLANGGETPSGASANGWLPVTDKVSSARFEGDTYNIGLDDQFSNRTLIYGGYRRGFKPGGFNTKAPAGEDSFAPETDDDFYVGLKRAFTVAGMPGRIDIEGYWDLYHDKQVSYLTYVPTTGSLATVTLNVPGTTYRGIDLDLTLDLAPWLRIEAAYSYIDAYNTKWPDPTYSTSNHVVEPFNDHLDLAKNPVSVVSPNKLSVTLRFHEELPGDRGELVLAPTIDYQDRWYSVDVSSVLPQGETSFLSPLGQTTPNPAYAYFSPTALGGNVVPAYALVDLRLEWNRVMGSKVNAALNVTNLTDEVYSTGNTGALAVGVQGDSYGPPRMVSFELSAKF